jgi:hypothetical protein
MYKEGKGISPFLKETMKQVGMFPSIYRSMHKVSCIATRKGTINFNRRVGTLGKKYLQNSLLIYHILQILNDITGNLDAKKACSGAMKLHKKYLKKV